MAKTAKSKSPKAGTIKSVAAKAGGSRPGAAGERFAGFPAGALKFLRQLEKNNDRVWFTPRKGEYDTLCVEPMKRLVAAVNERLARVAVEYVVPDPKKAIYRIYRDTRFSKDKTPYKTHVSAYFQRKGYARNSGPGFYVQVNHKGVGVAGGLYMVGPEELKAIREAIVREPKVFGRLATAGKLVAGMGPVQGESLKRPPKGFEATTALDEPTANWVRMKQWFFWKVFPVEEALDRNLPKLIADRIELMLPLSEWFHATLLAATAKDEANKPLRPAPMF